MGASMAETGQLIRMINDLSEARATLTRKRGFEEVELSPGMQAGVRRVFGADLSAHQVVDRILRDVQREGDAAVQRHTEAIDGAAPANLEVPRDQWNLALCEIDPDLRAALELSAEQISSFHR